MTLVWFIIWLIANNVGGNEPLLLDLGHRRDRRFTFFADDAKYILSDLNTRGLDRARARRAAGVRRVLDLATGLARR
jgi:hypothetical protein